MKKQPEQTAKTKQNMKDAFWKLYSNQEKVTVDTVSHTAGYNRCTFYRYYSDLDTVLLEIEQEICSNITQIASKHIHSENINLFVSDIFSLYEQEADKICFLLGEHGSPRFSRIMREQMTPLIIQRFPNINHPHQDLILSFISGSTTSCLVNWYEKGKPIPLQELAETISSLLYTGVSGLSKSPINP